MEHIDLNLLQLLDALATERSVTRTAERLGVTQSAVSHGLRRLRDQFGDPLFVRGSGGLVPTARMVAMAPALRDGLRQIHLALSAPRFDPLTSDRTFNVAAVSYVCASLLPSLIAAIAEAAPRIRLRFVALPDQLADALTEGGIELALGSFSETLPPRFHAAPLFSDTSVWVVAADHPLVGSRLSLNELLKLPQVAINAAADFAGTRGHMMSGGLRRRVSVDLDEHFGLEISNPASPEFVVYDVRTAMDIVVRTGLAAMVPRRIAREVAKKCEIAILEPPQSPNALTLSMIWHRDRTQDEGAQWLRDMIIAAAVGLGPG